MSKKKEPMELNNEILKPWMSDEEINLIKSYLGEDKIVFEWGAGGSTIEFSEYVKEYYSVEHDFDWYKAVFKKAGRNVKIYYMPPDTPGLNWSPIFEEGKREDFKNYIAFINNVASLGKKFDVILIDGRARADCAVEALPYVSKNTVVFIHNFDRVWYWKVLEHYQITAIADTLAVLRRKKEIFNDDKINLAERFLLPELQKKCGLPRNIF